MTRSEGLAMTKVCVSVVFRQPLYYYIIFLGLLSSLTYFIP